MKVYWVLFVILIFGCSVPSIPLDIVPEFVDIFEANYWISENVVYEVDPEQGLSFVDNWKTPDKTVADGFGDCEDVASLLLWIARTQFETEGELIAVKNKETGLYHMYPFIPPLHFEPSLGNFTFEFREEYEYIESYSLDQYLWDSNFNLFRKGD